MILTPEQELENAIIKVNYKQICDLLQMTDEQRFSIEGGHIATSIIKQFQTDSTLARAALLAKGVPPPTPNRLTEKNDTDTNEEITT